MYTVEFDHDEICITILDDTGEHEDLIVNSFDDIVYIRQHDPETNTNQVVEINPAMWEDLINSMNSPEGAFRTMAIGKIKS